MNMELIDLSNLNMTTEELFKLEDNSNVILEEINAPKYSYWKSVFRVFFSKKMRK